MSFSNYSYRLPLASWCLEFSEQSWQTLDRHAQRQRGMKESVGQLFTRNLTSSRVVVEVATVIKPFWASRAKVQLDTRRAISERETMFEMGFHCIGLWHTHPEPAPTPSFEDRALAREHALAAKPQLSGLIFAIVGNSPMPSALCVWVDDGVELLLAGQDNSATVTVPSPTST